jgi:D-proline reductase (dithiol) PrdB
MGIDLRERWFLLGPRQVKDKIIAKLLAKYPALLHKWVQKAEIVEFEDIPWTRLTTDVAQSRLALITTGGVHLRSQPPFDMLDPQGDPTFREIPQDTVLSDLMITHNYYDHTDADKDINIILPVERVYDLKQAQDIGAVNWRHFSFMGHILKHHIDTLMHESAPAVAAALKQDEVDIAILTPA